MKQRVHEHPLFFYIHACKPKAVAIAVNNVIVIFRILLQSVFLFSFSIGLDL